MYQGRERRRWRVNGYFLNTYKNTHLNAAQKLNLFYFYYRFTDYSATVIKIAHKSRNECSNNNWPKAVSNAKTQRIDQGIQGGEQRLAEREMQTHIGYDSEMKIQQTMHGSCGDITQYAHCTVFCEWILAVMPMEAKPLNHFNLNKRVCEMGMFVCRIAMA